MSEELNEKLKIVAEYMGMKLAGMGEQLKLFWMSKEFWSKKIVYLHICLEIT